MGPYITEGFTTLMGRIDDVIVVTYCGVAPLGEKPPADILYTFDIVEGSRATVVC